MAAGAIRTKKAILQAASVTVLLPLLQLPGADRGLLPGEGAKGMMTLYGMGMSDFWHTQTQICNFSRCLLPYYAWMVLNNHSRDTSIPSFCLWDEGTRAEGAGPSVPGVGARPSDPSPDPRLQLRGGTGLSYRISMNFGMWCFYTNRNHKINCLFYFYKFEK